MVNDCVEVFFRQNDIVIFQQFNFEVDITGNVEYFRSCESKFSC